MTLHYLNYENAQADKPINIMQCLMQHATIFLTSPVLRSTLRTSSGVWSEIRHEHTAHSDAGGKDSSLCRLPSVSAIVPLRTAHQKHVFYANYLSVVQHQTSINSEITCTVMQRHYVWDSKNSHKSGQSPLHLPDSELTLLEFCWLLKMHLLSWGLQHLEIVCFYLECVTNALECLSCFLASPYSQFQYVEHKAGLCYVYWNWLYTGPVKSACKWISQFWFHFADTKVSIIWT